MKSLIASVVSAGLLLVAGPALSCDQMGVDVHVGNIVSIDRAGSSFVILDAQTQQPIRFAAAKGTLDSLHVNDAVKVNYEKAGDGALRSVGLTRI
jgi:hypothetical protein